MIIIQAILTGFLIFLGIVAIALTVRLNASAQTQGSGPREFFAANVMTIVSVVIIASVVIMVSIIVLTVKLDKILSQLPA